jgi:hypothetical protein
MATTRCPVLLPRWNEAAPPLTATVAFTSLATSKTHGVALTDSINRHIQPLIAAKIGAASWRN